MHHWVVRRLFVFFSLLIPLLLLRPYFKQFSLGAIITAFAISGIVIFLEYRFFRPRRSI